jgi:hypothetical protein
LALEKIMMTYQFLTPFRPREWLAATTCAQSGFLKSHQTFRLDSPENGLSSSFVDGFAELFGMFNTSQCLSVVACRLL